MAKTPSISTITDSAAALAPDKIPSPLLALVGATDATAELASVAARTLTTKVAEMAAGERFGPADAKQALTNARAYAPTVDLRNLDLNLNLPAVDVSSWHKPELAVVAARALELAATAERTYEELVVRGERRINELRGTSDDAAPAPAPAPATPAQPSGSAKPTKPVKKVAPKTPKAQANGTAE